MYFKSIDNGYIIAVTTNYGQTPITAEEYNAILATIHNKPMPPVGYDYNLRADTLEWELVELPPAPEPSDEIDDGEAMTILMGGDA